MSGRTLTNNALNIHYAIQLSEGQIKSPEPKLLTPTMELRLSATSSRKTSDESLNLKNLGTAEPQHLESRNLDGGVSAEDVWLRVVGEIGRLVRDAAESFEGISDDKVTFD